MGKVSKKALREAEELEQELSLRHGDGDLFLVKAHTR